MESRFLNVSIMQHTITADLDTNLRVIEESVENLMMGYVTSPASRTAFQPRTLRGWNRGKSGTW